MIAGVVLAAGASTRMGRDKALVKGRGASFLALAVRRLWAACDTVVVVLGANADKIREAGEREFQTLMASGALQKELTALRGRAAAGVECHFVINPDWKRGMLSSARIGLGEALRARPSAVLVLPVDHPDVRVETVTTLAGMLAGAVASCRPRERAAFAYAVVPRHRGQRGHPLALTPGLARAVAADRAAVDLSDAVRRHARLVGYCDVRDAGVTRNRNTPRD
jgi:nicotine blue oxidoreductase